MAGAAAPAAHGPRYWISWRCPRCPAHSNAFFHAHWDVVALGLHPAMLDFWRSAPRLLFAEQQLVRVGGEERLVLTAVDRDTARRATLAIARETLEVRRFDMADA